MKSVLFFSLIACFALSFSLPLDRKLSNTINGSISTNSVKSEDVIGVLDDKCVYGNRQATLNDSFWLYMTVSLQGGIMFMVVLFFGGAFLGLFFSLPGALGAIPIGEILVNEFIMHSEYWKIIGPGETYQRGYSANRMVFYVNLVAVITSTVMICAACIYTSVLAINRESESLPMGLIYLRVASGCLITIGLAFYTLHFLLTDGIPSYYRGEWGDELNGLDCSGPYSYRQLGIAALIVEFSPIIGLLVPNEPLTSVLFNTVRFISALFVIFGGYNVYHSMTAIFTAVLTAAPTLLFVFVLVNVSSGNDPSLALANLGVSNPEVQGTQPSYQPIY